MHPPDFLDVARVTGGDVMGEHLRHAGGVDRKGGQKDGRDASRRERLQAR